MLPLLEPGFDRALLQRHGTALGVPGSSRPLGSWPTGLTRASGLRPLPVLDAAAGPRRAFLVFPLLIGDPHGQDR